MKKVRTDEEKVTALFTAFVTESKGYRFFPWLLLTMVAAGACADDTGTTPSFSTSVDEGMVVTTDPAADDDGILSAAAFWIHSDSTGEVFTIRWNALRWEELSGFSLTVHENSVADEVVSEAEYAADATEGQITLPSDSVTTYWFELRWFTDVSPCEDCPSIRLHNYSSPRRVVGRVGNTPPYPARVPLALTHIVYEKRVEVHPKYLDGIFQDRENDNDLTHTISSADTTVIKVWKNDELPERLYMYAHMFDTSTVVTVTATDPQGEVGVNEWEVKTYRFHTSLPPEVFPTPPSRPDTTKKDTTTTTPRQPIPPPPPAPPPVSNPEITWCLEDGSNCNPPGAPGIAVGEQFVEEHSTEWRSSTRFNVVWSTYHGVGPDGTEHDMSEQIFTLTKCPLVKSDDGELVSAGECVTNEPEQWISNIAPILGNEIPISSDLYPGETDGYDITVTVWQENSNVDEDGNPLRDVGESASASARVSIPNSP